MKKPQSLWFTISTRYAIVGIIIAAIFIGASQTSAGSYYAPDGTRPKDFTLFKIGDTWHLIGIHAYYNPAPGGPGSPGLIHSTSTDMISWTDIGPAIEVGAPGSWESYDVWAPTSIKVGETFHLWYTGVELVSNHWVQKIGHATSNDATTWTKDSGNPVFECSTIPWVYWNINDIWGGVECRDPYVIRDEANNQWVMFYTTRITSSPTPPYWLTNPPIIGMATSTDLVTWNDAGSISTTAGYSAESPHVFEHNGTWWLVWTSSCNWRGQKCLRYATAPSLIGPYTGYTELPVVGADEYASEYYRDESGTEYFGRVGSTGGWLDFDYLTWPNDTFTLTPTPSGEIRGKVWKDDNGDGQINNGEVGVSGVTLEIFSDNGDDEFDPNTDTPLMTGSTFSGPINHPLRGTYKIPFLSGFGELPWKVMWIRVLPDSLDYSEPVLTGMSATTPGIYRFDNRAGGIIFENNNFGFNGNDATAPATTDDLVVL